LTFDEQIHEVFIDLVVNYVGAPDHEHTTVSNNGVLIFYVLQ